MNQGSPTSTHLQGHVEQFVHELDRTLRACAQTVSSQLQEQANFAPSADRASIAQKIFRRYAEHKEAWLDKTFHAWMQAAKATPEDNPATLSALELNFEAALEPERSIEIKIRSKRLSMDLQTDHMMLQRQLCLRIEHLASAKEARLTEVLQPSTITQCLAQAWDDVGLDKTAWEASMPHFVEPFSAQLGLAYEALEKRLDDDGLGAAMDLRSRIRRAQNTTPKTEAVAMYPGFIGPSAGNPSVGTRGTRHADSRFPEETGLTLAQKVARIRHPDAAMHTPAPSYMPAAASAGTHVATGEQDPLLQEIGKQLVELLQLHRPAPSPAQTASDPMFSPTVFAETVISPDQTQLLDTSETVIPLPTMEDPEEALNLLRRKTKSLKRKTDSNEQKAVVELVSLMFQSILEDRLLPQAMRLMLSRLQMPIIRLGLKDEGFFENMHHPARQLLDHIGIWVARGPGQHELESDVLAKMGSLIQDIELTDQPTEETFSQALERWAAFVAQRPAHNDAGRAVLAQAQQLELQEISSAQYTLEFRNMLSEWDLPDTMREFLYQTWAEVLAASYAKVGPDHPQTLHLKEVAAKLIWSAMPKAKRTDHVQMVRDMPKLVADTREGLRLIMSDAAQLESKLMELTQAMSQSLMSRGKPVGTERMQQIRDQLTSMENEFGNENLGALAFHREQVKWLFAREGLNVTFVDTSDEAPLANVIDEVAHYPLGGWYHLWQNDSSTLAQLGWRSQHGQLCLLTTTDQHHYIYTSASLANQLHNGHIERLESDPLSLRATQDALEVIAMQPSRLLQ
jgi:hypothetical protein